jgi:hypothetical protein
MTLDGGGKAAVTTDRIARTSNGRASTRELIERLIGVAKRGLPDMYDLEKRRFVHCIRRGPNGTIVSEGESLRYGGAVLLGARWLPEDEQRPIFGGETAYEFCARALEMASSTDNLGDAALIAWAAAEIGHPDVDRALSRALELEGQQPSPCTVDSAWLLCALVESQHRDTEEEARRVAGGLLASFGSAAGVFPKQVGEVTPDLRSHVACFADQVYPIQALSRLHKRFGSDEALAAARTCGERICEEQGEHGQWWWHYDVRTGGIVEGYPVYSVHQDAMAAMALLDLEDACGASFDEPLSRGLEWMREAPEIHSSLLDEESGVIWRKVARVGPPKIMRAVRAVASRLHEDLRLNWLEPAFPPRSVDWESRPYHLGWVLHAWLTQA